MNIRNRNVDLLRKQYQNLKGDLKSKVNSLVDLYRQGNIFNINTLRYEINNITAKTSNQTPHKQDLK